MVVLYFSCNFDVVLQRGEPCLSYRHLDQESPPVLIDVGLGCLFVIFLSSLGRPVLLRISLSGLPLLCTIGFGLLCVHFNLFLGDF